MSFMTKSAHSILLSVSEFYGIGMDQLTRRGRHDPMRTIRQVAMLRLADEGFSLSAIANETGLGFSSSVHSALKAIRRRYPNDGTLKSDIHCLRNNLNRPLKTYIEIFKRRRNRAARRSKDRHRNRIGIINTRVEEKWQSYEEFNHEDGFPGFGSLKTLEENLKAA
jgi:hypothetical protein